MSSRKNAWINALFLMVTLGINTLGALGIINGLSQKEVSDMFPTLITPSPSTFSIWSVIYSLLIISVAVMIIKKDDSYYQQAIARLSILFRVSCILNIAWIVAFSFVLIELSTVFILSFVVVLALICKELLQIQQGGRWLLPLSFGLYTGWLFIASVVNISAALVKLNWGRFGIAAEIWAVAILIVSVFLIIGVLLKNRNAVFPLPVAWAYLGIYQFLKMPEGYNGQYVILQMVSLIGMAVLIGAAAIQLYRNNFSLLPTPSKH